MGAYESIFFECKSFKLLVHETHNLKCHQNLLVITIMTYLQWELLSFTLFILVYTRMKFIVNLPAVYLDSKPNNKICGSEVRSVQIYFLRYRSANILFSAHSNDDNAY